MGSGRIVARVAAIMAIVLAVTAGTPGNKTTTYTFDPQNGGRPLSMTDGLGNKTTYGYDTSGFLHTVTDPNGDVTTTGHDVRGNMVSQTTCQNQATQACSTTYYTYFPAAGVRPATLLFAATRAAH
jgi:large repetitive protein